VTNFGLLTNLRIFLIPLVKMLYALFDERKRSSKPIFHWIKTDGASIFGPSRFDVLLYIEGLMG
jgi:hypothetical protein